MTRTAKHLECRYSIKHMFFPGEAAATIATKGSFFLVTRNSLRRTYRHPEVLVQKQGSQRHELAKRLWQRCGLILVQTEVLQCCELANCLWQRSELIPLQIQNTQRSELAKRLRQHSDLAKRPRIFFTCAMSSIFLTDADPIVRAGASCTGICAAAPHKYAHPG